MSGTVAPYPLHWPTGVPRTPALKRQRSPFRTSFDAAVSNVAKSLRLFQSDAGIKIDHVVLSSNVDLLNKSPVDPGAAAWFRMDGQFVAFGVDRFADVAGNVQAIHHIIEARRTELRYGGLAIVRQTFRAFVALPAPAGKKTWREVLLFPPDANVTPSDVYSRFRDLARRRHPDAVSAGGSHEAMTELTAARDEALKELS